MTIVFHQLSAIIPDGHSRSVFTLFSATVGRELDAAGLFPVSTAVAEIVPSSLIRQSSVRDEQ